MTLGDRVGQSGIEYSYDRFLRGKNGANRLQVDALGTLEGELAQRQPVQGRDLRLTVDLDVQAAGQSALAGTKGAFVVMDVKTGEIRALGSSPSFDPNIFSKGIRETDYKRLNSRAAGEPLANRAIQGLYPTGSTFKLVTSVAALQGGVITPDTIQVDTGSVTVGGIKFKNAGDAVNGPIALRRALEVSSDVFFYKLGIEAFNQGDGHADPALGEPPRPRPQDRDRPSGGDPGPRSERRSGATSCSRRSSPIGPGRSATTSTSPSARETSRSTRSSSPIAYATIANGGHLVRPHLGKRLEDSEGRVLQEFDSPSRKRVDVKPEYSAGDPRGPAPGRERRGRHLGRRLQGLPRADRG